MSNKTDIIALPEVEGVSWAPVPGGWALVYVETLGNEIIRKELLSGPKPLSMATAVHQLQVHCVVKFQQAAQRRRQRKS